MIVLSALYWAGSEQLHMAHSRAVGPFSASHDARLIDVPGHASATG